MSQQQEFAEIMSKLAVAFNVQPSPARTSIYWEELQGYSTERLRTAASEAIRSLKMFPSVFELIQLLPPPEQPKLLSEPPPTQAELTYGQWQCRFALWLIGKKKIGTKKLYRNGHYVIESAWQDTQPRWKNAQTQSGRQILWDKFCKEANVPQEIARISMN